MPDGAECCSATTCWGGSIPSHHFWHLKRASSKVRCSCLEDRIEPAPHSSCCHASGRHSYDGYFTGGWFPPGGSPCVCHQAIFVQLKWTIHQALVSQHIKSYRYSWNYEHHYKSYVHKNDARLPDQNDRNLQRIVPSTLIMRHNWETVRKQCLSKPFKPLLAASRGASFIIWKPTAMCVSSKHSLIANHSISLFKCISDCNPTIYDVRICKEESMSPVPASVASQAAFWGSRCTKQCCITS